MAITKELLDDLISVALKRLYERDIYLINTSPQDCINYTGYTNQRTNGHVCERAIVFRIGIYLQQEMEKVDDLKYLNLDCEYNRDMYKIKSLPGFKNGTYPDLIIHSRGRNDNNILVLEFKSWWNNNVNNDVKKLKEFTSLQGKYKYHYGVSLVLNKTYIDTIRSLKWFEGCNKSNEKIIINN